MKRLIYVVIIAAFVAAFPSLTFAAAYSVAGKSGNVFLEYSDIEIYFPSEWAQDSSRMAERLGIAYPDRIEKYNRKLTRKELAYVSVNLCRIIGDNNQLTLTDEDRKGIAAKFKDSYRNGKLFDDEVFLAIKYNLMYGTSESLFSPDAYVTREQTAAVLYRIVEKFMDMANAERADLTKFPDYSEISPYAQDCLSVMVGKEILSGTNQGLAPKNVCTYEEVLAIASRFARNMDSELRIGLDEFYGVIYDAPQVLNVHSTELDYQGKQTTILDAEWAPREGAIGYAVDCRRADGTVLRTLTSNTGVTIFESDVYDEIEVFSIGQRGKIGLLGDYGSSILNPVIDDILLYTDVYVYNDYSALINQQNETEYLRDYSDDFKNLNPHNITLKRYSSNSEAMGDMVEITVNIWKMGKDNTRIPGTASFYVHHAVAQDVIEIFTDIYNGPEQFPIYAVSGYNWRGASSSSSHNQGLAIDINPDHNYFISTKGRILAGKLWEPSLSPYSIKPDGDVVRAFNKKGWFWGGIGWSTTGKDFMHFSYTGV